MTLLVTAFVSFQADDYKITNLRLLIITLLELAHEKGIQASVNST
jgi:hypothetical protein